MLKKILIDALVVGMHVKGFAFGEDAATADTTFMNTIRIGSKSEVEAFKAKGYKYAFLVAGEEFGVKVVVGARAEQSAKPVVPAPPAITPADKERYGLPGAASVTVAEIADAGSAAPDVIDSVPFDKEIGRAKAVKAEASSVVANFMHAARAGKGVDGTKAKAVVGSMVDSVLRNQDALLSLSRLKDYDNYTFGHSVNVSIIAVALGRHLGLSAEKLSTLGFGAILHDVGKMQVPDKILNKPAILTDEEFAEMKNHVVYGATLLSNTEHIGEEAIGIAFQHHERYDGKGYPRGFGGRELHPFSRIVAIADVYDAMTTVRPYSNGSEPGEALKRMYGAKGAHFDPMMMDRFIKCIGIYPIGSYVKLDDGEIAQVKSVNRGNLLRPVVTVLYDEDLRRLDKPVDINLDADDARTISSPISLAALGLPGGEAGLA